MGVLILFVYRHNLVSVFQITGKWHFRIMLLNSLVRNISVFSSRLLSAIAEILFFPGALRFFILAISVRIWIGVMSRWSVSGAVSSCSIVVFNSASSAGVGNISGVNCFSSVVVV